MSRVHPNNPAAAQHPSPGHLRLTSCASKPQPKVQAALHALVKRRVQEPGMDGLLLLLLLGCGGRRWPPRRRSDATAARPQRQLQHIAGAARASPSRRRHA